MPPEIEPDDAEPGDLPDVPRPRRQTRLIGHRAAERAFAGAIGEGRLHHAWLIGGPRGIGKATLAYRVARRLLAVRPSGEGLEVDPADPGARKVAALSHPNLLVLRRHRPVGAKAMPTRIGVEAARAALDLFGTTAGNDGWRVCIVDSAEDLNANSANALLKMIEEPPERALFLIVSHAPGRLLPTIRSRCRMLPLRPLPEAAVAEAIAGLPAPFRQPEPERLARALALSEGSVARALAMLDPKTLEVVGEVESLLARPDRRRALKLAERLSGRDAEALFETALDTAFRFVSAEIDRRRDEPPARLAALAEVCEKSGRAAREAAIYNLDRRPVVLSLFGDLAEALQGA